MAKAVGFPILGAPTANQMLLLASPGFDAEPGAVTPDFTLPAGFFDPGAESVTLNFGLNQDTLTFTRAQLPTNGIDSLNRDLSTGPNSPTNFAGQTGSVSDDFIFGDNL